MENTNMDSVNKPTSTAAAQELWEKDKKEFALWALSLVGAKPIVHDDRVDGILGFVESGNKKQKIFVQVKGINITPRMIKDLVNTIEKEGTAIGLLISLNRPILSIITDSVHAGNYESELWKKKYLKIQIRTVGELLEGKTFDIPPTYSLLKKTSRTKKQGETARLL